jgi:hypothetical protein
MLKQRLKLVVESGKKKREDKKRKDYLAVIDIAQI